MNTLLDPRQAKVIDLYSNPKSDTFGDFKNSLIKAGYSPNYAHKATIAKVGWILPYVQSSVDLIKKSERVLNNVIDKDIPFNKENIEEYKLKLDASKFIIKNTKYKDTPEKTDTNLQVNIVQYKDDTIDISTKEL